MQILLLTAAVLFAADEPADTVVVCPAEFAEALQPWLEHRVAQGHRFAHVSNQQSADLIRKEIRKVGKAGNLRAIVLVGDADPRAERDSEAGARSTPTHHAKAKVNVLWGSEPQIATDNWYADLDDDQLPDVAIGRLSADSPEELSRIVAKTIDYEKSDRKGMWRRRVNFVAGVGGFGKLADSVLETTTKKFLTDGIPASYETTMTYGSWRSPFCPDPRRFHQATLDRLTEGSLFWVYIGHGQRRYLDRVPTPTGQHHIFDTDDVVKLQRTSGAPIAVFLACYTGAFDEVRDSLGEELLRNGDGPVATLCGSRITMPYAMAVMGNELMGEYFRERRETLGAVVMHAKRRMARTLTEEEQQQQANRHVLDSLAAVISPAPELLDEERREHVLLFNLLGDPLLRLQHPRDVRVEVDKKVRGGSELLISANSPIAGQCTVELVCRRDRMKVRVPTRDRFDPQDDALADYNEVYAKANDRTWARRTIECRGGEFVMTLPVPKEAHGACFVRLFVESEDEHAVGAAEVFVRKAVAKETKNVK
jgi:hypothetical protein